MKAHTVRVWFCDEWNTWCVSSYDVENNPVLESEYTYLKADAARLAKLRQQNGDCSVVVIESASGRVQNVIGEQA